KVQNGAFVWTDATGTPDTSLAPPADPATVTSGSATFTFSAAGQLVGGGTTFPAGADFDAYVPEQVAFDPLVPGSFTHSLPMTVYDSLGNPHQLTQYFVKREAQGDESVWNVYYRLDNNKMDGSILDGGTE